MACHSNFNKYIILLLSFVLISCGDILDSEENVIKKDITPASDSSGWEKVQFSGANEIEKIFFVSPKDGFLLAGDIYSTNDSGKTWSVLLRSIDLAPQDTSGITNFDVIDLNVMYVSSPIAIYKTSTGGKTWTQLKLPGLRYFFGQNWDFFKDNVGYIGSNMILRTDDNGISWYIIDSLYNENVNIIYGFESSVVAAGDKNVRTIDLKRTSNFVNLKAKYMDFTDNFYGCFISDSDSLFKTNNGGMSWNYQQNPQASGGLRSMTLRDNYIWLGGAGGEIWGSIDNGNSWIKQLQDSTFSPITAIHFYDNKFGWAGGRNGLLLRTTTGGFKKN